MATTGIWPVRANLLSLIRYTGNPEITSVMDDLRKVIDYNMNDEKTEQKLYVTGINCLPTTAYERMMTTKKQFGKVGGVVAYHGFQSFPSGEVTPLECHRIGVETARRLWGERFEVTVSTHRNTDNLHNHFCINSVSFVDGKKFENKIREHMRLREISDAICKEQNLSVLKDASFYAKQKKREYWKGQKTSEIEREIVRRDFYEAASRSIAEFQFCDYLRNLGYYINRDMRYEHISVTPPGWKRAVRVDTIIPEFDRMGLRRYMYQNARRPGFDAYSFDFKPLARYESTLSRYRHHHDNVREFVEIVFDIIKLALGLDEPRERYRRPVFQTPAFRKEIALLNERQRIIRFVSKYDIHTPQSIRDMAVKCEKRMEELKAERTLLYNRIRRPKAADTVEKLKAARDSLTEDIAKAREELKAARYLEDLLHRLEREVEEELVLERGEKKRMEPITADQTSRMLNDPKRYAPNPKVKDTPVMPRKDTRDELER